MRGAAQANTIDPVARMKKLTAELAADGAAAASLTPEDIARQVAVLGAQQTHTRRRQHTQRATRAQQHALRRMRKLLLLP